MIKYQFIFQVKSPTIIILRIYKPYQHLIYRIIDTRWMCNKYMGLIIWKESQISSVVLRTMGGEGVGIEVT